jgi:hypothetical protein
MADINKIIDELLLELSVTYPFPNMKDKEQVIALMEICDELGYGYIKPNLYELLSEAEDEKESGLFPGKFHLGGGYYSSKDGGEAEFKNDKGNLRPVTPEEKAKFDSKGGKKPSAEKPTDTSKPNQPSPETPSVEKPKDSSVEAPAPLKKEPVVKTKVDVLKSKVEKWSEKEKEFFNKGQDKPGSETRRSFAEALKDKAKGARNAIMHGLKHEVHTFKTAGKAVKNLLSRKPLEKEEKKALISVGIKVASTALFAAAGGGLAHGAAYFAKHVAMELIPHAVAETIIVGVGKASLFAGADGDDERMLGDFMDAVADNMENMEIPEELMMSMVDSYNEKKKPNEAQSEVIDLNELFNRILNEEDGKGESKEFPGKFHLGGGYYSSTDGGAAEFKNDKGNLRPLTDKEKEELSKGVGGTDMGEPTDGESDSDKPDTASMIDTATKALDTKEKEAEKTLPKDNPDLVLDDPKASTHNKAKARAFKSQQTIDKNKQEDSGKGTVGEPTRLESANEDTDSKVQKFKGKKSGREIQTIEFEDGGMMFGTVHGETKMVDDIIDQVKATIPQEEWENIVFLGEGGATNDEGDLEFNDEMDYAAPRFEKLGAGIDTWDGDELDVHDDQSKLYKKQMEKTGLNHSQVKAGNWASMIGQGEGTDTMSPKDFLDDEGRKFLEDAVKEAGFPPIENFDNPTGEVPNEENPEGSGDKGTLFRLAFPEDNGDKETKINDIQVAFNNTRDENIIEKRKELVAKGKIPIVIAGESHVELVDKMMQGGSKRKTETQSVEPEKIADEMPEADKETFSKDGKALDGISPNDLNQFNTDISKISKMLDDAKAKGEPAPNINLCDITIPGTNLYCDDNQGIPREEMPQFKGKAVDGSRAAGMETDKDGEVDTEPVFREMLKEKNIKVLQTEVPADKLKATQKDLVGEKVIGMMGALEKDPNHPKITAPIYVSRDGYVIDGHHRWAAIVAHNAKNPNNPIPMKSTVIDMDIKDAIPMANKFAEDMGIAAKKADAKDGEVPAEEPKVTDDKIGTTATTKGGKVLHHIGNGYYSDSPNGDAKYIRVETVVNNAIEIGSKKWWNLLFNENIEAAVKDGTDGVFKEVPEKDIDAATAAAKEEAPNVDGEDSQSTSVTPLASKKDYKDVAAKKMNQPKYKDTILDDNLKEQISTIVGKMTRGEDLTDEEQVIAKDYIKIVNDKEVKIYIASKKKGDWPNQGYIKVAELGAGKASREWAESSGKKYGVTIGKSGQGAVGKKDGTPLKIIGEEKYVEIEIIDEDTVVFNGVTHKRLAVPTIEETKAKLKESNPNLSDEELEKKATDFVNSIKSRNDSIDEYKQLKAEISKKPPGKFKTVDIGDTTTPEGRKEARKKLLDKSIDKFTQLLGDKIDLPENQKVMETFQKLKDFEDEDLENNPEKQKEYQELLNQLLTDMFNSKDFRDGLSDYAEVKVAMSLIAKGNSVYLPADEAFKTADVLVVNEINENETDLEFLMVTLEFSGGISVKVQGGAAGVSEEKWRQSRFKSNQTRNRGKRMLSTFDFLYPKEQTPPNFPPSNEQINEQKAALEDDKKWMVESGIATEEELKAAEDWAERRVEAVLNKFKGLGVLDCMSDEEKVRFEETMKIYYRNQKISEVLYNNDLDYTNFKNSNQKFSISKGKAVKCESEDLDGVENPCYMKIKDDVGFNDYQQGDCTVVRPTNVNPSEIHKEKPKVK